MSVDKLVDSTQLDADLTSVANAIRTKGGTSASLAFPAEFVQAIGDIPSGGGTDYLAELANGALTELDDDNIVALKQGNMIRGNTTITRIFLKNCKSIEAGYALAANNAQTCVLPSLEYVTNSGGYNFGTSGFKKIDFGVKFPTTSLGLINGFLTSASALTVLILRNSTNIVPMNNLNTFNGTPFKSGGTGGTIYIPKALYDHLGDGGSLDYKAATNWSAVNGYGTITWAQIEGSQYENYYADGTPIA